MKIALASDLHLEFGTISLENEGADVLILSGDILVAHRLGDRDIYDIMGENTQSNRYHTFMQECSARFPNVILIAGNHEHYDGDFPKTIPKLKEKFSYLKNVHVLDKEWIEIDGITFFGGTLWTNMNNCDTLTLYHIKSMMNDFRIVSNTDRKVARKVPVYKKNEDGTYMKNETGGLIDDGFKFKEEVATFSPEDAVADHVKYLEYLKLALGSKDTPFVVVGHHAPSKVSTKPRYQHDTLMNGGYSSDLSEFILDHPKIKLWTHGHTHDKFDYMIGDTRIVCNPRGYIGYEKSASDFALEYIDV
jgi:predicted phosphodiesterase